MKLLRNAWMSGMQMKLSRIALIYQLLIIHMFAPLWLSCLSHQLSPTFDTFTGNLSLLCIKTIIMKFCLHVYFAIATTYKSDWSNLCFPMSVCWSVCPHWPVPKITDCSSELPRSNSCTQACALVFTSQSLLHTLPEGRVSGGSSVIHSSLRGTTGASYMYV